MDVSPYLEQLRLTRFKSFRDAVLPLRDLTLLIGRNGSGKSNTLDALHVLSRLAEGEDLREAIDGNRRDGEGMRGGVRGCAPYGETSFALGCTVVRGEDRFDLDVEVQVEPDVQIVAETLRLRPARGKPRDYLTTDAPQPGLVDIAGRYFNGRSGVNPAVTFRSDRLLTAQVPTKVPTRTIATRAVHDAALAVVETLRAVFILDPVPSLMRHYVPARDTVLRRQADNLSAVIAGLQADPVRWARLAELVEALPEQQVVGVGVESSQLGDVILTLRERFGDAEVSVSSRVMSDGMLRFLAFAAALLEAPELSDEQDGGTGGGVNTQLVIEEIENGLHPSQAARIVQLIKEESARRRIRTLATTHSPAMLTALGAADHDGVVVCRRNPETAGSELIGLVELPGYAEALAAGSLGDAVTQQRLGAVPDSAGRLAALDDLLASL
ncbi:ATP-binding protein [Conexibacter stalactiti]|uniref:ATP-binding protein n=1 Tax=Conexibacter stalactiti TaxID=1940611 RepID=A0ABU4HMA3_9ACTN|nr:ATP-binding protein [Conexibacter stalactiti]MDW5593857.1 ATP-binding protein [Conexibacter stalactiti]MEC5034499.1 ATP-binding protein [Conexibacter stalactiti]